MVRMREWQECEILSITSGESGESAGTAFIERSTRTHYNLVKIEIRLMETLKIEKKLSGLRWLITILCVFPPSSWVNPIFHYQPQTTSSAC